MNAKLKQQVVILGTLAGILFIAAALAGYFAQDLHQQRQFAAARQADLVVLQQRQAELTRRLEQLRRVVEENGKLREALQRQVDEAKTRKLSPEDRQLMARIGELLAAPPGVGVQNEIMRAMLGEAIAAADLCELRAANVGIEREVEKARELQYKTPVVYRRMQAKDFPVMVRQQIREEK